MKDKRLREKALRDVLQLAECLGFEIIGQIATDVEDENKKNLEYLCCFTLG